MARRRYFESCGITVDPDCLQLRTGKDARLTATPELRCDDSVLVLLHLGSERLGGSALARFILSWAIKAPTWKTLRRSRQCLTF